MVPTRKVMIIGPSAESFVTRRGTLITALLAHGGVSIIACAPDADDKAILWLDAHGIKLIQAPFTPTSMNPWRDVRGFLALRTAIRQTSPDLVLNYTIKPVIFGSIAAASLGIRRTYSLVTGLGYAFGTSTWKQRLLRRMIVPLYRAGLKVSRVIFFQNLDDLELFRKIGIISSNCRTVVVNGSGVDLNKFEFSLPVISPMRFLLIARLLRDKGIVEFVEAARIVKRQYPNTEFHLLGAFHPNPASLSKCDIAGWVKEGIIQYFEPEDDVRPHLRAASVFVLPSYREGTPLTVLEAMAVGRPIITTDVPGCRETVVNERNGFLVPAGNSADLAERFEYFLKRPEKVVQMGRESRLIAEVKFDARKINKAIIDIILEREEAFDDDANFFRPNY